MTQKRSSRLAIEDWRIDLPAAEPLVVEAGYVLSDRPITRLHVHECLELGCCHEGHGVFVIADKVRTFSTGDLVLITSAEPHFARSAPGTSSRWTWLYLDPSRLLPPGMIDPAWVDTTGMRGASFPNVFSGTEHPLFAQAVFRLAEEAAATAPGRGAMIRALVAQILLHAHRSFPAKRQKAARQPAPDYRRLAPALQILARDYARTLRIRELAKRCGLSEPQFRRVFRRTMGCSPLAYQHDLRIGTVAALLRGTSKTVLEISLESGFESVSSLHRAFRARMGTSPRAWRNIPGASE